MSAKEGSVSKRASKNSLESFWTPEEKFTVPFLLSNSCLKSEHDWLSIEPSLAKIFCRRKCILDSLVNAGKIFLTKVILLKMLMTLLAKQAFLSIPNVEFFSNNGLIILNCKNCTQKMYFIKLRKGKGIALVRYLFSLKPGYSL